MSASDRTFASGGTRHSDCDCCERAAERISELEAALKTILEKSTAAVNYFDGSGEMLFLNFATGTRDTARGALQKSTV